MRRGTVSLHPSQIAELLVATGEPLTVCGAADDETLLAPVACRLRRGHDGVHMGNDPSDPTQAVYWPADDGDGHIVEIEPPAASPEDLERWRRAGAAMANELREWAKRDPDEWAAAKWHKPGHKTFE